MQRINIGQAITRHGKIYAVVEVLDCPASYEPHDEAPELPAVVVSPVRGGVVLGRTRVVLRADDYELTCERLAVREYKIARDDNEV